MNDKTTSLFKKFRHMFFDTIETRDELIELLADAKERDILDMDAYLMLEGVLSVSDMQARDIMIPRTQMVMIERDDPIESFLPAVLESGHSRFPVVGDDKDKIIGILMAKDLLNFVVHKEQSFSIRDHLRPAVFVPESKRLNVLLKEFRSNRNHMAIVVDEYGGISGLITIEDILEEIVGEIVDEHDVDNEDATIRRQDGDNYAVDALTKIDDFNEFFDAKFSDEECDTVGGLLMQAFGHMPKKGEHIIIDDFQFEVIEADDRRVHRLRVKRQPPKD